MAVMMPREKWTDERLDDLNKKVDNGFAEVKADLREIRGEIKELNRALYGATAVIIAALIGTSAFL